MRRRRGNRRRSTIASIARSAGDRDVPMAEVAIVGGVAVQHVVDHLLVPRRFHLATHLAGAGGAVIAGLAAGATLDDLGVRPARARRGLRGGGLSALGITSVVAAGALLPRTRRWFDDQRVLDVEPGAALYRGLVEIPLGTAVYEEVVFRGVLLGLALRRMRPLPAALATSALFGLWHILPSLRDREHHPLTRERHALAVTAATVANTSVVGLALAGQRLRTGSVVAPILTHAASNSAAYLAGVAVARTPNRPTDDGRGKFGRRGQVREEGG
jgi:uncharacterized protein